MKKKKITQKPNRDPRALKKMLFAKLFEALPLDLTREDIQGLYEKGQITKTIKIARGILAGKQLDLEMKNGVEMVVGEHTDNPNEATGRTEDGYVKELDSPIPFEIFLRINAGLVFAKA